MAKIPNAFLYFPILDILILSWFVSLYIAEINFVYCVSSALVLQFGAVSIKCSSKLKLKRRGEMERGPLWRIAGEHTFGKELSWHTFLSKQPWLFSFPAWLPSINASVSSLEICFILIFFSMLSADCTFWRKHWLLSQG